MIDPYYSKDGITIYNCDAREILDDLSGVDLVLTDPPYGVAHKSEYRDGASWAGKEIANDFDVSVRDDVLDRYSDVVAFGVWNRAALPRAHTALVWDKGPASGGMNFHAPWRKNWETIYIRGHACKGGMESAILSGYQIVTWESKGRTHPHEKPVSLLLHLLRKAPDAQLVLDPFMGSGSTLVACKALGLQAIGIEIDPHYCEVAVNRLDYGRGSIGDRDKASEFMAWAAGID